MFTAIERENFAARGLIKRTNFLPIDKLANARQAIFQHMAQVGIWRDGDWYLDDRPPTTELAAGMALIKPVDRHPSIVDLMIGESQTAASDLADGQPVFGGQPGLLFTLPNAPTWSLPHQNWHTDFPRFPDSAVPGVQIFAILDSVKPSGGGTLVVTGSHRLVNEGIRMSSADFRKKLKRERYFAELMSPGTGDRMRFLHEVGHVGDVELQVVELTGEPGDTYFMDIRMLHTLAPNALQRPRLMLTQRYLVESTRIALEGK